MRLQTQGQQESSKYNLFQKSQTAKVPHVSAI